MTPPAPTITSINDKGTRCKKSEEAKVWIWEFYTSVQPIFWIHTRYFKTLSDMESKISLCPFLDMIIPFTQTLNCSCQNIRTFPIKVYLETAGKAVNYWLSIWPSPREVAGSPVGILRTHICSGAPGRWSSTSDIDGMAPKTSVLPFPACAFFPRGSHLHIWQIWTQMGLHAHLAKCSNDEDEDDVS